MAQTIDKIIVHADDPGLMYWFVDGARMGPLRRDYADKLAIEVGALRARGRCDGNFAARTCPCQTRK